MNTETFDIIARAPGNQTTEVFRDQARLMARTLLADRFKLALHRDTREVPVYALVLARCDGKLGPQFRRSNAADCAPTAPSPNVVPCEGGFVRTGRMAARVMAFSALAQSLSDAADRPVIDQTGLAGTFDWDLQWTPEQSPQPETSESVSLFTALQEQLGLKLDPTRGPVEVLVIDHVERPTED